ncbi:MAG: type II toxin-antitoxin system RelE/ParE family toxin [Bdellovibrionales bacterium]
MIQNFSCRETEKIWNGVLSRKFPPSIQDRALRKLRQLDASRTLDDLRVPPSNHLEQLRGDKKGWMSIRVNNQWRLCFRWHHGEIFDVKIIDYH